jgi:hypothetical protein
MTTSPFLKIKHTKFLFNLLISLLLVFSVTNIIAPSGQNVLQSGFTSAVEEAANAIKGFGRFIDSLRSMIDVISTVISLEVLLLFIAAALIGFGLSFLGIPKGKFSFLCSIIIADIFWYIWSKSFNPEFSDLISRIFVIIKTNIIILIPFLIVCLFQNPFLSKKVIPKFFSFVKSVFRKKTSGSIDIKDLARISDELNKSFALFNKSLINDLLNGKKDGRTEISSETLVYRKEIETVLGKLNK